MQVDFYKYQGTGNDFIFIDNRQDIFPKNDTKLISKLCDRRFGIGADGLILLENDSEVDFHMDYYNSDASQSMCGNGGRCAVAFAKHLGMIPEKTTFRAIDGIHDAVIDSENVVTLQMHDVTEVREKPAYSFLNTGSPHHVQIVEGLEKFDVKKEGAKLRYGMYGESGSNINFVEQQNEDSFDVRTYERGVENETLSCGTGVTAVAIAMHKIGKTQSNKININTKGGDLAISFETSNGAYSDINLIGPTQQVFKGEITW